MRTSGALVLLLAGSQFCSAEPLIKWVASADRIAVEVSGLDDKTFAGLREWPADQWSAVLAVRVQQARAPAMLGAWHLDATARVLRFTPQFPLTSGVAYSAVLETSRLPGAAADARRVTSEFTVPTPPRGPATVVKNIFPSADEVPENLLKFYLHFSAPMSGGHIYDHIHLRDERGKDVELPFLEIDEELWDREMKRLTLFIDPGRIKRGVRPLEEIGPALEEGRRFTLVIDAAWLDANGQSLAQKYERTFRVGPPDRRAIVPKEWKIAAPAARSLDPLRVAFSEPMDHALALRLLLVIGENGARIEGRSALADAERTWSFTPSHPWQVGSHTLVVPTMLEDLAGNNVGRSFEVELLGPGTRRELTGSVKLPFVVK